MDEAIRDIAESMEQDPLGGGFDTAAPAAIDAPIDTPALPEPAEFDEPMPGDIPPMGGEVSERSGQSIVIDADLLLELLKLLKDNCDQGQDEPCDALPPGEDGEVEGFGDLGAPEADDEGGEVEPSDSEPPSESEPSAESEDGESESEEDEESESEEDEEEEEDDDEVEVEESRKRLNEEEDDEESESDDSEESEESEESESESDEESESDDGPPPPPPPESDEDESEEVPDAIDEPSEVDEVGDVGDIDAIGDIDAVDDGLGAEADYSDVEELVQKIAGMAALNGSLTLDDLPEIQQCCFPGAVGDDVGIGEPGIGEPGIEGEPGLPDEIAAGMPDMPGEEEPGLPEIPGEEESGMEEVPGEEIPPKPGEEEEELPPEEDVPPEEDGPPEEFESTMKNVEEISESGKPWEDDDDEGDDKGKKKKKGKKKDDDGEMSEGQIAQAVYAKYGGPGTEIDEAIAEEILQLYKKQGIGKVEVPVVKDSHGSFFIECKLAKSIHEFAQKALGKDIVITESRSDNGIEFFGDNDSFTQLSEAINNEFLTIKEGKKPKINLGYAGKYSRCFPVEGAGRLFYVFR